jgi:hypothetical protein
MEEGARVSVEGTNEEDVIRAYEFLRQLRELLAVQQEEARLRIAALAAIGTLF